ncbi:MAG: Na/Pi cotransporter family protein [Lachnospiraceae bacterium]|nr:Na/Pi cotransporter family protein [Lachnospiraceae bacterium]
MSVFSIFTLLGGLAFFIYGMNQMSRSLEMIAGEKMEQIINKLTGNRLIGLFLGCLITIAIQSSSAVTVMLVGLVNSGLMNLSNTVGVIMGSNIGTTITAWIMSLIGISSESFLIRMLKPESFAPLLAFIGIVLIMLSRLPKKREIGNSFVGFGILMYGMMLMSSSVSPLADSPAFTQLLTAFKNPLLGLLTGLLVTAVIQSSAASIGMLQALSMTGGITYGIAIPIIMGQNIGTCATAILSSIGVSRHAKRVAAIHLSFNLIGTAVFMLMFYGLHLFLDFTFMDSPVKPVDIALCHSIFNIATTVLLLPFSKLLVKIAEGVIKVEPQPQVAFLDERLFKTPAIAVGKCDDFATEMAELSESAIRLTIGNYFDYEEETAGQIEELERQVDLHEDRLGTYLIKLSGRQNTRRDKRRIAKMLYSIGDWERISDHARDLSHSAREIKEKRLEITRQGKAELLALSKAVEDIVSITKQAYINTDIKLAKKVEPLEQVIDLLVGKCRESHIKRLQGGECTLERGFVLADSLNSYERISDHCSNIAIAVLESGDEPFNPHEYMRYVKSGKDPAFQELFQEYQSQYLSAFPSEEGGILS